MVSDFAARYGPTAVVTGAAQGIGAGFARNLAARGLDLVLTDVQDGVVARLAQQIHEQTGRKIDSIGLDMCDPAAPRELDEFSAQHDVGLIVCNHLLPGGTWQVLDTDVELLHRQLQANVSAYVDLAHHFGRRLRHRGRGGLILMSSLTAAVGSPYVTTYGACKAFMLAFGSGLSYELGKSGIDVLTLVPSSVDTETYRKSTKKPSRVFPPMTVDDFVVKGLSHLGRRWVAVPGARNALTAALLMRLLPRRTAIALMGANMESMLRAR